jgi:hypoxanthine phosphoribosyltransferase
VDASDVQAELKQVLIPADRLQRRVAELAAEIDADYAGRELLLVGVLKGAVMVMADLARAMHLPVEMDWMAVSSYGSGTRS